MNRTFFKTFMFFLCYKFCFGFSGDGSLETTMKDSISFQERVKKELEAEKLSAGSIMSNQHFKIPSTFKDYGRRFVFQYPYTEKQKSIINITDESRLDKVIKEYLRKKKLEQSIIPVKASPEFVLSVAKRSALLAAATPIKAPDEEMQRNILRTGEYWNDVIEEPVDPEELFLRSKDTSEIVNISLSDLILFQPETITAKYIYRYKLDSINLQFLPGSSLYELVAELSKTSPRLLYVINDDSE